MKKINGQNPIHTILRSCIGAGIDDIFTLFPSGMLLGDFGEEGFMKP